MRKFIVLTGFLALAGCFGREVPNSSVIRDGQQYPVSSPEAKLIRDTELQGDGLTAPHNVDTRPLSAVDNGQPVGFDPAPTGPMRHNFPAPFETTEIKVVDDPASNVAADAAAVFGGGNAPVVQQTTPATYGTPTAVNATGISNEQDFNAVDAQRSIEADAARMAQNQAQYQVAQPEALPARVSSEPNIVEYAISSNNPMGSRLYNRGLRTGSNRIGKKCGNYASADLAQRAFLEAGGPRRDRLGLDPDGDGYACAWDPAPFRNAVGG